MEIFLQVNFCSFWTSSPQMWKVWCGEKSLVVSQPQRQRCCVHGYVASTGTWCNECNESTDGRTKSTFENKILHILISPVFFTVSTSKTMTGCFRSEFFVVFVASQSLEWALRTLCPESFPWWQIAQALESRQSPVENGKKKRLFLDITRIL